MTDFFSPFGETAQDELVRIHDAGPEGLRRDQIHPGLFGQLERHGLIEPAGPSHFRVSRRGNIELERRHLL